MRARSEGDAYDENGVYWFAAKTPPDGPPIPPEPMTDPLQGLALTVELMWVYRADYDRDGLLDSEDLAWFLDDFHHAKPDTDLNRDGLFTPADLALYVREYSNRQMKQVGPKAYFPRRRGE
ncbi:MAG: GC-type dockerin domain-anchored protein [Planctomycetota bacterium]|nr:GC-type dockerin domain-anchored protein [Planctomycetota bacterium]